MALASILVVDHDAVMRAETRAMLELAGYVVTEAANGRQALQRVATSNPDLVVTAILMPDGDGIEFTCAMRDARPTVIVIAVSAHRFLRGLDLFELVTKLGAKAVLTQPLQPDVLLATISRLTSVSEG